MDEYVHIVQKDGWDPSKIFSNKSNLEKDLYVISRCDFMLEDKKIIGRNL